MDYAKGLTFYDTLTRQKKPFNPIESGKAGIYVCGPTVYGDPHIGNFRTFTVGDILRRWLEYRGYEVFMIINLTDIDDKTIRGSGDEGVSLQEYTDRYIKSFLRGVDLLSLKRSTTYPRATEYIPQMIEFTKDLLEKGIAYVAGDGVYFDIDKFPGYGKLSGIDVTKTRSTERMTKDEYEKEAVHDFVLWKKSTEEEIEKGIYYDSPWGKGRPGWHIECSVMTRCLLGDTLDIHVGGEDLVFPHHENEIAQSESLTGKQFVNYWMHVRHLMINGRSMSKSLGNYVSFDEVISKFGAEAYRYFLLSVHYRRPLDYTEGTMTTAKNSVDRLENTLNLIDDAMRQDDNYYGFNEREKTLLDAVKEHQGHFEDAMDNDLNTHGALDALHAMSGTINEYVTGKTNKGVLLRAATIYRELLSVLGLFEKRGVGVDELTSGLIETIAQVRERLRTEKNFQLSDKIRDDLERVGVVLSDTAEGTSWKIDRR
jgi:cysteinyl-tRNA synthetase